MDPIGIQTIKIDMSRREVIAGMRNNTFPTFVQGDTNRIIFDLYENGGEANLSEVGRAVANFSLGGYKYSQLATVEGNQVIYDLGSNESALIGDAEVELQLYNADSTKRLSTMRIKIRITPAIGEGDIVEDNPSYTDLQTLFIEVDGVKADVIAAGEYAKSQGDAVVGEIGRIDAQLAQTEQQINKINAPKITPIEIIAHRGFAELAPENTMSAYSQAISIGATSLECDVQITSDGVPVVIHDSSVNRTTGSTGNVKEMTLAQLRALDAGSYFSPFYAGSKIPTFDEFLKYAKGRSLRIYPEIKDIRSIADIQLIVNSIKDNGMENVTVIQSFNLDHLLEVRKFSETIKLGLLIYNTALSQYAIDTLSNDGNAMILYGYSYIISNPSIVKQFYDLGIDLGVWVVPNKQTTLSLLELGVTKQMFDLYIGGIA